MSLWDRCKLEGVELDAAIATVYGITHKVLTRPSKDGGEPVVVCMEFLKPPYEVMKGHYCPSTNWAIGGPMIEAERIFIEPPHSVHRNGGPNAGWEKVRVWHATVGARKEGEREIFGRGEGPTPLIAAMRAIVDSRN